MNTNFVSLFFKKYQKFIVYSVIGLSGVFLDLLIFLLLFNLFSFDKNIATSISTSCGIINNFCWNIIFNFKTFDKIIIRFISFFGVGLVGLLLTFIIFYIFVDKIGLNTNIVKVASIVVVVLVQFNLNKLISFRKF
jgi:putative flippase GtrA